jgi:hypothetical protein
MKNATLLSRAELKTFKGGLFQDVCKDKTGVDLENCRYNVCMSGWDSSAHTDQENENKVDSCAGAAGMS